MEILTKGVKGNIKAVISARSFDIAPVISRLRQVLDAGDYRSDEASINAPFDEFLLDAIDRLVGQLKTSSLRYVFLVGIGGSNLGAKAIYEALCFSQDPSQAGSVQLICLDTVSETMYQKAKKEIAKLHAPEEYLLISISKSGHTTETMMNTELILSELSSRLGPAPDRLIVISDAGSDLIAAAKKWGAHTFAIPPKIGGRYSVFSAVGLVPLALVGVNIRELVKGAQEACARNTHHDPEQNPAAISAILKATAYEKGKRVFDLFIFNPELESFGKWWRQLTGESLGKNSRNSEIGNVGFMPTVSIGSTDLHSVGQLYLGGEALTFTSFLEAASPSEVVMPAKRAFASLVPMISGKSIGQVRAAILSGTKQAFFDRERPFLEIVLPGITPYELGFIMQTNMIETMYLGHLLEVDPFDQPDVEAYKEVTRTLLEKK